jgi:hypothetical protein
MNGMIGVAPRWHHHPPPLATRAKALALAHAMIGMSRTWSAATRPIALSIALHGLHCMWGPKGWGHSLFQLSVVRCSLAHRSCSFHSMLPHHDADSQDTFKHSFVNAAGSKADDVDARRAQCSCGKHIRRACLYDNGTRHAVHTLSRQADVSAMICPSRAAARDRLFLRHTHMQPTSSILSDMPVVPFTIIVPFNSVHRFSADQWPNSYSMRSGGR